MAEAAGSLRDAYPAAREAGGTLSLDDAVTEALAVTGT